MFCLNQDGQDMQDDPDGDGYALTHPRGLGILLVGYAAF